MQYSSGRDAEEQLNKFTPKPPPKTDDPPSKLGGNSSFDPLLDYDETRYDPHVEAPESFQIIVVADIYSLFEKRAEKPKYGRRGKVYVFNGEKIRTLFVENGDWSEWRKARKDDIQPTE